MAIVCVFSDKAKGNHDSFEEVPLKHKVLPLDSALTLAQIKKSTGEITTLLVIDQSAETIHAVDLFDIGVPHNTDFFEVTAYVDRSTLIAARPEHLSAAKIYARATSTCRRQL